MPNLQEVKDQVILALKVEQQRLIEKYAIGSDETKDSYVQEFARGRYLRIGATIHNIKLDKCNNYGELIYYLSFLSNHGTFSTGQNLGFISRWGSYLFDWFKSDGHKNIQKIIDTVREIKNNPGEEKKQNVTNIR